MRESSHRHSVGKQTSKASFAFGWCVNGQSRTEALRLQYGFKTKQQAARHCHSGVHAADWPRTSPAMPVWIDPTRDTRLWEYCAVYTVGSSARVCLPADRPRHPWRQSNRPFRERNLQRSSCSIIPARPVSRFRPHNCAIQPCTRCCAIHIKSHSHPASSQSHRATVHSTVTIATDDHCVRHM